MAVRDCFPRDFGEFGLWLNVLFLWQGAPVILHVVMVTFPTSIDNMRHYNVRLSEQEIDFLKRQAKQNDRTAAAELRRMLRREMQAERGVSATQNFGRI